MENQILISQLSPENLKDLIRTTLVEVMDQKAPKPLEEKYLTRLEVCDKFRISLPTLHQYVKRGILKGNRFGRRVLFLESDIQESLKEIPTRKRSKK